jgi:hypothetical protein
VKSDCASRSDAFAIESTPACGGYVLLRRGRCRPERPDGRLSASGIKVGRVAFYRLSGLNRSST